MMWCIHSFFQKPCFFGYQMKSLFAYQSGCKKAASSQCLLWFTSDFSPGNTDPNQQLLGQMPNCLTECDFVPPGWTVEKGCQNWEDWRFSNKKLKPGVKFLMDFFFPLLKLPAECHFFCGTRAGYRPSIQAENGWECANGYIGKAEVFCLPSGGRFKPWELEGSPLRCAQVEGGNPSGFHKKRMVAR